MYEVKYLKKFDQTDGVTFLKEFFQKFCFVYFLIFVPNIYLTNLI